MHPVISTCLLLAVSAAAILPAFPVLILLQNYFPEFPSFYSIDSLFVYVAHAALILTAGVLSMCVYSDVAGPLAIRGFVFVFSRM